MRNVLIGIMFVVGIIGISALIVWGFQPIKEMECHSKYDGIGKPVSYGFMKGCQIEHKPGEWIPSSNYRVME